uniref:SAP30_Sin3_bdg domain-containing protein n=1 Tax=Loa loa TaxID=7209 RepID=A0A1I7W1T3_LOALO
MSCPMLEPKLSASVAAKASISVTPAVTAVITTTNSGTSATTNNTNNSMAYPYKKRVRDEFEKRQREIAEEGKRLQLLAQAKQQLQQQQEQQQHYQFQQEYKKQLPKKQQQRQKYKSQPGTSGLARTAAVVITASGNIPECLSDVNFMVSCNKFSDFTDGMACCPTDHGNEVGTSGISRPELPSTEMTHRQLRDDESDVAEEEAMEASSDDSESSGDMNWSELDQAALEAKACCCLATLTGGKAIACGRPAFGIWFSNKLRQMALKKNLPFAYNKGRGHWYTCLFHFRVIMHESKLKPDEKYEERDLTKYLAVEVTEDEFQAFKNDPLTRSYMKDYEQLMAAREMQKKKKKKKGRPGANGGDAETSDDETPSIGALAGIWPFMSTNFHTMKEDEEVNASPSGQGPSTSAPLQVPFHALSATTLRRYKKYFNLPHRSSTNTKQQLLEGILEHFETIDAPAFETIAYFLHTAKTHKNKLDYPTTDS